MNIKILVTGGCGYIGSHTIIDLLENGYDVVSIDNLSNSNQEIIKKVDQITKKSFKNYVVDLCDIKQKPKPFL
jgi:UDP-glucose 4-epimerase